mgnify:FL=1
MAGNGEVAAEDQDAGGLPSAGGVENHNPEWHHPGVVSEVGLTAVQQDSVPERVVREGDVSPGLLRRSVRFLSNNDLARDLVVGLLLVLAGFGTAFWLENRIAHQQQAIEAQRADRAEVLENTRFVREVAINPDVSSLPFSGLNLRESELSGLDLSCRRDGNCASLVIADLSKAKLFFTDLSGANLSGARLTGAKLSGANFSRTFLGGARLDDAVLIDTDLTSARLMGTDLTGANLTNADLSGSLLQAVCYHESTIWGDKPDVFYISPTQKGTEWPPTKGSQCP